MPRKRARQTDSSEAALYKAMLGLGIIALLFSVLTHVQKIQGSALLDTVCSAVPGSDCVDVQNSAYGKLLGIDTSFLGIIAFVLLDLLLLREVMLPGGWHRKLALLGALVAGIAAMVLVYIQAAVLQKFCTYCLIVDFSSILIALFAVAIIWKHGW